jgi:hypothetical protein
VLTNGRLDPARINPIAARHGITYETEDTGGPAR